MTEALARFDEEKLTPVKVEEVKEQVALIQELMRSVMRENEHFGIIPGTKKPSLYKPGAEKLGFTFRLTPEFEVTLTKLERDHREYQVICTLRSIKSEKAWGQGVGCCSTMETKYRYRESKRKCPKCDREAIIKGKEEFGGGWLCWKKQEGCGAKFLNGDESIESQIIGRVENPDIADAYNTVLKMAKKRAHVDAILTATAASDIFTQDVEDHPPAPPPPATEAPPGSPAGPSNIGTSGHSDASEAPPGDPPPPDAHALALEDWRRELAEAGSLEKLSALWKSLEKPTVWSNFKGPEQVGLRREHDKRKTVLQQTQPTLV